MADYSAVREAMEECGMVLASMGMDAPMRIIEGENAVGRATRDCRTTAQAKTLKNFLRETAESIKKIAVKTPKQKQMQAKAISVVEETWKEVQSALREGLEDDDSRPGVGAIANYVAKR